MVPCIRWSIWKYISCLILFVIFRLAVAQKVTAGEIAVSKKNIKKGKERKETVRYLRLNGKGVYDCLSLTIHWGK
jgi:hypothetical protein